MKENAWLLVVEPRDLFRHKRATGIAMVFQSMAKLNAHHPHIVKLSLETSISRLPFIESTFQIDSFLYRFYGVVVLLTNRK